MTPPRRAEAPSRATIQIATPQIEASIATAGYVSGVSAGTFLDRKTGARDLGHGLDIVDFLLEPAPADQPIPKGQYEFGNKVHGDIPKRYVEGPQICTRAGRLPVEVLPGPGFVAIRMTYRWQTAYPPRAHAGSVWQQTLIFPDGERFFLAADRVTTVSESDCLFFRVDMPGHIKHERGRGFEHVYLSYHDPAIIPSTEFAVDFPPDGRFLYRRGTGPKPERFIRAYQVVLDSGKDGPWLAGLTLEADDVYQAWCHQRGYVCMIQELGGRPSKPGETFGAAYVIGWFDDIESMQRTYDRYRGFSGLALDGPAGSPTGFRGLKRDELTPIDPDRSA